MARFRPAMDFSKVGSFGKCILVGMRWPILFLPLCLILVNLVRKEYEIWMIIYMYHCIMYVQAKMVLGLSSATKAEELDSEDIHKKFISKLALVISLTLTN